MGTLGRELRWEVEGAVWARWNLPNDKPLLFQKTYYSGCHS